MEGPVILGIVIVVVIFAMLYNKGTPTPTKVPALPWYEDPTQTIAIRPYATAEMATRAANLVAGYGWSVQSVSTTDGHVNVGTVLLTGGLSAVTGNARTKGQTIVTFIRVPVVAAVA